MRRRAALRAGLVLGPLAFLAAACGTSDSEPPAACPAAILPEGADLDAAYQSGTARAPSALRYVAALSDLEAGCRYEDEGLEVDLAFDVVAERGPALGGGAVQVTYFVATVGPDGEIRSKQLFDSEFEFEPGRDVSGVGEELTLRLPDVTTADGPGLRVVVGFQTDRDGPAGRSPLLR